MQEDYTRRTLLALGTNVFFTSDEHFDARDKCFGAEDEQAEKVGLNFSHTHAASYQRLPNRTFLEMIAPHWCSPPKTGGSYYALVLTSEYTTSTSYIHNSILCWTERPSSRLS